MKILYIAASLSSEWGGPVTVIKGLTEALIKKGIEVSIFAPIPRNNVDHIVIPNGANIKIFPQNILSKIWTGHSFSLKKELQKEIYKFDLIHIHEIWHYPHYVAHRLAKKLVSPISLLSMVH